MIISQVVKDWVSVYDVNVLRQKEGHDLMLSKRYNEYEDPQKLQAEEKLYLLTDSPGDFTAAFIADFPRRFPRIFSQWIFLLHTGVALAGGIWDLR